MRVELRGVLPRRLGWLSGLSGLGVAAVLSGCVDPKGNFEEFVDRYEEANPGGSGGSGGTGGVGECAQPDPEELNGDFLLALAANIDPAKPTMLYAESRAEERDGKLFVIIEASPLAADDRRTIVGDPVAPEEVEVTAGELFVELPSTTLPGEANAILPGVPLTAAITLSATLCSVRTPEEPEKVLDFFCGDMGGTATSPLMVDLAGSTFAASRITDPDNYPEVIIDCEGNLADPLPEGG